MNRELKNASGPALSTTLSESRKNMVDIAYEDFIDCQIIGPREKYRIVSEDEGRGKTSLYIYDRDANVVGPDIAKIVINQKNNKPRMLFKDPDYGEWIEPESFYPFSSNAFYENDINIFTSEEGFSIEAIKAPVWHGITGIGVKVKTDTETLIFSSDTAHDKELWKQLYEEKRTQRLNMSKSEFESASVIYGDINDYIERAWSENRYKEAINAFNDAIVVHDLSV